MSKFNIRADIKLSFPFTDVEASTEDAAIKIAGQRLDKWLAKHNIDKYELYGDREVFVEEEED